MKSSPALATPGRGNTGAADDASAQWRRASLAFEARLRASLSAPAPAELALLEAGRALHASSSVEIEALRRENAMLVAAASASPARGALVVAPTASPRAALAAAVQHSSLLLATLADREQELLGARRELSLLRLAPGAPEAT